MSSDGFRSGIVLLESYHEAWDLHHWHLHAPTPFAIQDASNCNLITGELNGRALTPRVSREVSVVKRFLNIKKKCIMFHILQE